MAANWGKNLQRWVEAKLIDVEAAERIRAFEAARAGGVRWGWAGRVALVFGVLTLGSGILLFIAAHWDELSPGSRFLMVLGALAALHAVGASVTRRSENLATALHVVGTIALGGAIFLVAQIFNLQEHWPSGMLLWAVGAWLAWLVRRDWPHASLAAILTPAWLVSEWIVKTEPYVGNCDRILDSGLLLLAITYFSLGTTDRGNYVRRSLALLGAIAVIPMTFELVSTVTSAEYDFSWRWRWRTLLPPGLETLGWIAAFGLPTALAVAFRRKAAVYNLGAAVWVWMLGIVSVRHENSGDVTYVVQMLGPYILGGLGSAGLVAWGIVEARKDRVNVGVIGFGVTILTFYFSTVMDMLSRSTSLMGLGIIFLLGGWELERARRHLVAQLGKG